VGKDGNEGSLVLPDIIVHHRTQQENLLAIEMNQSTFSFSVGLLERDLSSQHFRPGAGHGLERALFAVRSLGA